MKFYLPVLVLVLLTASTNQAQTVTWAEDVAPIIYNHCTTCHRPGEIGPFPLTNYEETVNWASMINYVTEIRYMPPWKADPNYGAKYLSENYLSEDQIATIKSWVENGTPRGNQNLEPPTPVFPTGSQVGTPDLVLSFAKTHIHPGNDYDEYRYFVLPTGLQQPKDLVALEMRPGNTRIVHHALVWADTTGTAASLDAATPEYGYQQNAGAGNAQLNFTEQLPAYVPGQRPHVFNHGMAQKLPKNSDLVIQVHYAPTTTDEPDSSSFNLFFANQPASRFVRSFIMLPPQIVNGPFVIPPNTIREFQGKYKVPYTDVSIIGISPHCHMLGKKWRVYAKTPAGDTIPLIQIEDWDFNWQGTYHFQKPVKLPKNSEIFAFATYDNTSDNPFNPNNPPISVSWGESTNDEMYYLPFLWLPYQAGDENLDLSNSTTSTANLFHFSSTKLYPINPNPVHTTTKVGFTLAETSPASLGVWNLQGQQVQSLANYSMARMGEHILNWEPANLPPGLYVVSLRTPGGTYNQKVLVR